LLIVFHHYSYKLLYSKIYSIKFNATQEYKCCYMRVKIVMGMILVLDLDFDNLFFHTLYSLLGNLSFNVVFAGFTDF